ncbi:Hypothetical protein R9X50_00238000 [Acrodontium crateriforme]|uniref:Tocopherol cyclase n=1 Tax=Acrodontium crateriforme TaxID=150365 RepID=A0AAQ3R6L2_9PEZI|nr:Hypothetical protein R9X50_00238000 [Acrodontium crateriforme]
MQHNAPHKSAVFEGYYSKFHLPSGASLAIVVCKVRNAPNKPHQLSFTYVPHDAGRIYQQEIWAEELEMIRTPQQGGFSLELPSMGHVRFHADGSTDYMFETAQFSFHATTTSRTPWSTTNATPEGWLVYLPLPLHWHVHSLESKCTFDLTIPSHRLPRSDEAGNATVHEEKNWAHSFPSAHMWLQARKGETGFCSAGGQILGMDAFLIGYRSKDLNLDFRPPFALRLAGLSPFMSYKSDWDNRLFELSVQSFNRKLSVKAVAPRGSFFSLSSPFPEGHRENYLGQSFKATIEVKIYERKWFGQWNHIRTDVFEDGSLEFGGAYYPLAGSEKRFN